MPHITIEYSSNVADRTNIQRLVERVHRAALDTGAVPLSGLRTRAFPALHYLVGDGHPDSGYLAVFARLAAGRTPEQRAAVISSIAAAVETALGEGVKGLAISVEYIEIEPEFRLNLNHVLLRATESAS
jgi:5-carboxymethyl-2-hydroxymuconate isomerase